MNKLLEVVSVTKTYHNAREKVFALKDFSLPVFEEDYLAIVGPSGAGKSTLLHVMGGLDYPSKGKVFFRGRDIYKMKDKELSLWRSEKIGFVFQFYHLIEELNVLENVAAASLKKGGRKSSLKEARELLQYLGIEARENFFPSQLSGGERQKAAVARALANGPEVILCDEPTGNLDKASRDSVIRLLNRLNKEEKKAVIIVTHNLELAKEAKRILFIKGGELDKGEE